MLDGGMQEGEGPVELDRLIRWIQRRTRGCTPLDRLVLATKAGVRLQEASEELIGHFVEEARTAGASWAQIGSHLGVSKQAAQQRHVGRRGPLFGGRRRGRARRSSVDGPFEHLTGPARHAIVLAEAEARELAHNYIGTEHILLGLLAEPAGTGGSILRDAGATSDRVRAKVLDVIGRGASTPAGPIPFTPRSKRLLQRAADDAERMGREAAGTGRLLLAMVGDREGVAAEILVATLDVAALRQRLERLLADGVDV
jgi:hypothetical protein